MIAETPTLCGAKVRLRPRREDDLPHYVRWYNDPDVRRWLHISEDQPSTLESERDRFLPRGEGSGTGWTIETIEAKPIGSLGLIAIDRVHGRAMLGVSIGEKGHWNQGNGTEAIRLALAYAFEELGLRRVELITDEDNERGIRCYEKCGFVREGLLRSHRLRYGRPINMLVMGVLDEEWHAGRKSDPGPSGTGLGVHAGE